MSAIVQGPATLAIRGIFALLFGIIAILMPASAFWALVFVFGAYALLDGIWALGAALSRRARNGRGWLALEGIAGIVVAILTVVMPGTAALVLIALAGAWAFVTGIFKIVLAVKLRREIPGEWLLALSGGASLVLAFLIIGMPITATLALVWTLGIYAFILGGLMIALSLRIRRFERSILRPEQRAA